MEGVPKKAFLFPIQLNSWAGLELFSKAQPLLNSQNQTTSRFYSLRGVYFWVKFINPNCIFNKLVNYAKTLFTFILYSGFRIMENMIAKRIKTSKTGYTIYMQDEPPVLFLIPKFQYLTSP